MKKSLSFLLLFVSLFMLVNTVNASSKSSCEDGVYIEKSGTFEPIGSVYAVRSSKKNVEGLFGIGYENGDSNYGNIYTTDDGDYAYCLQAGNGYKKGNYCPVSSFDVSSCKKSNDGDYRCGLAYILIKSVELESSYGVVQTALRLYASTRLGQVDKNTGIPFYKISYEKLKSDEDYAQNGIACDGANLKGVICTGVSEEYLEAFALVTETMEGQEMNTDAEGGGSPHITTELIDETTEEITATIPITVECVPGTDCGVKLELIDKSGNNLAGDTICEKKGKKIYCRAPITESQICDQTTTTKRTTMTIRLTIENFKSDGTVAEYEFKGSNSDIQKMMVIKANREGGSSAHDETTYKDEEVVSVVCGGCTTNGGKCPSSEMIARTDFPSTCTGYDNYNQAYKKDPYMNCILNTCDASKAYFEQPQYEPDNGHTCKIYCREDIDLYMANRTKVYSGMQFKYKIEIPLKEDGKIQNSMGGDNHLTSVVIQKRECTSEIYFSKWLSEYDDIVKKMVNSFNNWKKFEVLASISKSDSRPDVKTYTTYACDGQQSTCTSLGRYSNASCNPSSVSSDQGRPSSSYTYTAPQGKTGSCGTNGSYSTSTYYVWPASGSSKNHNSVTLNKKGSTLGLFDVKNGDRKDSFFQSGSATYGSQQLREHFVPVPDYSRCSSKQIREGKTGSCVRYNDTCGYCEVTSITQGTDGRSTEVDEKVNTYRGEYQGYKDKLGQMIYVLQSCNFYGAEGGENIAQYYNGGSGIISKEEILSDSQCEDGSCVSLDQDYDDKKYGKTVEIDNASGISTTPEEVQNKYCAGKNCYKYVSNQEYVETNTSSHKQSITIVNCKEDYNGKCEGKNVSIPKNTHVTFTTSTQVDFWQSQEYVTSSYTGNVYTKKDSSSVVGSVQDLSNNLYPTAKSTSTGFYDIRYNFTNIGQGKYKIKDYTFTCQYDAKNVTTQDNCRDIYDADGKIINKCSNECYKIEDGVPNLECINWPGETESSSYGYIYRSVDLANMFPSGNREIGTNWSNEKDLIAKIQANASNIFNPSNLEYRFVLTTADISKIRNEYNDRKSNNGYLNNTLYGCTPGADGTGFYNCKSTFFNEMNLENKK